MKMIWVVTRPEFAQRVIEALDNAGISGMTRLSPGYGHSLLPPCGPPDESREILMITLPDTDVAKAVNIIRSHARSEGQASSDASNYGRIFVTYIDESFTIRTYDGSRQQP
jgi:nitrogen regulatory protein PII